MTPLLASIPLSIITSCTMGKNHAAQSRTAAAVIQALKMNVDQEGVLRILRSGNCTGNEKTAQGNTLLQLAVMQNYPKVVEMLIERGANLNVKGVGGATALSFAALRLNPLIVSALLLGGADPNLQTDRGMTPLNQVLVPGCGRDADTASIVLQLARVTSATAWIAGHDQYPHVVLTQEESLKAAVGLLIEFSCGPGENPEHVASAAMSVLTQEELASLMD